MKKQGNAERLRRFLNRHVNLGIRFLPLSQTGLELFLAISGEMDDPAAGGRRRLSRTMRACRSRFPWMRDGGHRSGDVDFPWKTGEDGCRMIVVPQCCRCLTDRVGPHTFGWLTIMLAEAEGDQMTPPARFAAVTVAAMFGYQRSG